MIRHNMIIILKDEVVLKSICVSGEFRKIYVVLGYNIDDILERNRNRGKA